MATQNAGEARGYIDIPFSKEFEAAKL